MSQSHNQQMNSMSLPPSVTQLPYSIAGTQFAVIPNPSSNGQYSFLIPLNNIHPSFRSSIPTTQLSPVSPVPFHYQQQQNRSGQIPLTWDNTSNSILPLLQSGNAPIQFESHIPSTITSIRNLAASVSNVSPTLPLLPSCDANVAASANLNPQHGVFKFGRRRGEQDISGACTNEAANNPQISFSPHNAGQIVITKRERDPLMSLPGMLDMSGHSQTSSSSSSDDIDDDDKRSVHSSTSTISTASTRGSSSLGAGKPDYVCAECGKTFKHKSNLKIHAVIHTDQALSCGACGKKFARKSNLTQHLRVHTGERPYICSFCNKSFKQSHSLKDHVRIHTGEKPYDCGFCNKSFKVKHNMVVHRRLHTGEKPFDCPLCMKKFASKSSLNGHTKKTHPNQWWTLHPECKVRAKKYDARLNKHKETNEEQ